MMAHFEGIIVLNDIYTGTYGLKLILLLIFQGKRKYLTFLNDRTKSNYVFDVHNV